MLALSCPDETRLSHFLQGRLNEDDSGSIVDHLAACARCESLATEMETDGDWLVRHLRAAGEAS